MGSYSRMVSLSNRTLRNPQGSDFVLSSTSSELSPQDSKAIRDTRVYYIYSEEYTLYTLGCICTKRSSPPGRFAYPKGLLYAYTLYMLS